MGRRPSSSNGSPWLFVTDAFARIGHVEAVPGSADLTIAADCPAAEIARPGSADEVRAR